MYPELDQNISISSDDGKEVSSDNSKGFKDKVSSSDDNMYFGKRTSLWKGLPSTIKKIAIYNASFGTRELGPALLSAIRSVYFKPWNVSVVDSLERDGEDTLYIIICPAGLGMKETKMPKYYINWQLEYLNGNYDNDVYVERLRGALANWDYSQFNIDICKNRYNIESIYVPPGFNETISTPDILNGSYLYTDQGKDVDVLFLGYCEAYPRRILVRDNCYKSHMRMWFVSDLDIEGMKRAIRRAKICINMAAFEGFILHKIRMNILLANQACVVSEASIDREADAPYGENGVCFVPYDSIIEKVWDLLDNYEERRAMALQSHRWYRNDKRWVDIVDFNRLLPPT